MNQDSDAGTFWRHYLGHSGTRELETTSFVFRDAMNERVDSSLRPLWQTLTADLKQELISRKRAEAAIASDIERDFAADHAIFRDANGETIAVKPIDEFGFGKPDPNAKQEQTRKLTYWDEDGNRLEAEIPEDGLDGDDAS